MFTVGDKVVYPMYGAGVIEELEEKVIDGVTATYYILRISVGDLKIAVSTKKADMLGIRHIMGQSEVMDIIYNTDIIDMPDNWNQRYKENLERIKTGKLSEVAAVFKTLMTREKSRSLSSVEKKMLGNVKQIILSEIILSQNMTKEQAERVLAETMRVIA